MRVTSQEHKDTSTTFVFKALPLIYPTINNNHSAIVSQLKQLGIVNISVEIAKQKQGFAGRLREHMHCPVVPVGNSGVSHRMAESSSPEAQPSPPSFLSRRDRVAGERNKQMLEKQAISLVESHSEMQGFLSSFF